jgi:hypothetical protein
MGVVMNQYLPVNWTDGMKINKDHFIAQDNACMFQLAQNTGSLLNELNYGLLPAIRQNTTNLKISLSADNQQQVQVRIRQCRAITWGGYYIQFDEDTALVGNNLQTALPDLSVPFQELAGKASSYFVVLSVNPYQRVPFGMAAPGEIPPRIPFTMPSLGLSLMPVAEVTKNALGLYQVPVGKLKIDEQRVLLDEDYIPPCSIIASHNSLLEIHAGLEQFFGKMELYALQIIQKILQKKQNNEMAAIVQKLCESISFFTATQLAEIKALSINQPPVYMISKVSSFARMIKNTLDFYVGSGKEELVNYFTEWCEVTQGELEGSIVALSNHQYDHLDINASVEKVLPFTRIISLLFNKLARLDYIGKRKEAGIFVKEETITHAQDSPAPPKRRSFLAD